MATINREDRYTANSKKLEFYSDFMINFNVHPNKKDIVLLKNEDSVKRALRTMIMTNKFEKFYQPNYGGNINKFLFEPISEETTSSIKNAIKTSIENFEPRVNLLSLRVDPSEDENAYNITIVFATLSSKQPEQLSLTLYRVR